MTPHRLIRETSRNKMTGNDRKAIATIAAIIVGTFAALAITLITEVIK